MTINEILAAIQDTAGRMQAYAEPLSVEQLNTVPYPNSWTAAQLLRHLVLSTQLMTHGLETPGQAAGRAIDARTEELRQIFVETTQPLKSPDVIIPEAIRYEKAAILGEWHSALHDFQSAASTANLPELVTDLPLGPVTKLEIIHFVLYHTQRHLGQMKRITDALVSLPD